MDERARPSYLIDPTMSSRTIDSAREVHALLDAGHRYLDVRTEAEFEAGHPPGACNVPLQRASARGDLENNDEFLAVVRGNFEPERPIVVGCKAGGRSRRAIAILEEAGFASLVDYVAGWDGKRDAFGRSQPGWSRSGLPVECGQPEGRRFVDLARNKAD